MATHRWPFECDLSSGPWFIKLKLWRFDNGVLFLRPVMNLEFLGSNERERSWTFSGWTDSVKLIRGIQPVGLPSYHNVICKAEHSAGHWISRADDRIKSWIRTSAGSYFHNLPEQNVLNSNFSYTSNLNSIKCLDGVLLMTISTCQGTEGGRDYFLTHHLWKHFFCFDEDESQNSESESRTYL